MFLYKNKYNFTGWELMDEQVLSVGYDYEA